MNTFKNAIKLTVVILLMLSFTSQNLSYADDGDRPTEAKIGDMLFKLFESIVKEQAKIVIEKHPETKDMMLKKEKEIMEKLASGLKEIYDKPIRQRFAETLGLSDDRRQEAQKAVEKKIEEEIKITEDIQLEIPVVLTHLLKMRDTDKWDIFVAMTTERFFEYVLNKHFEAEKNK